MLPMSFSSRLLATVTVDGSTAALLLLIILASFLVVGGFSAWLYHAGKVGKSPLPQFPRRMKVENGEEIRRQTEYPNVRP